MKKLISINKMAEQMGLTSRTLRYWESEHLFTSNRDGESGWRTYDEHAILCIQITAFLRKMDVPIKEIKSVIENMNMSALCKVISKELEKTDVKTEEIIERRTKLEQMQSFLSQRKNLPINAESFEQILIWNLSVDTMKKEEKSMMNDNTSENIQFVTIPPMRMVYHIAVSTNPEDEAMNPVLEWIKSENLMGTARLFGGNMEPMPSGEEAPYGYGFFASIPETIAIPENLQEMRLPGGIYAIMDSTDDISGSWQRLMKDLSNNTKYISDRSRLCLEEHVRTDNPEGCENMYSLRLMEPVKLK